MKRHHLACLAVALAALTTSACKPALVVLQNKAVQETAGKIAADVAVAVLKKIFDGVSTPAKAEPRPDIAASAAQDEVWRKKDDAEREARLKRLEDVFKANAQAAVLAKPGAYRNADGTVTFVCTSNENEPDCLKRLHADILKTVSGRADALANAFTQCQQQAGQNSPRDRDITHTTDVLNECVAAQGFKEEVVALDPNFAERRRS